MVYTRTCVLCDRPVPDRYVACSEHIKYYMRHKDELWMKEIVGMERRQQYINEKESLPLFEYVNLVPPIGRNNNEYRNRLIVAENKASVSTLNDISRKFNLTETHIKRLIKKDKEAV